MNRHINWARKVKRYDHNLTYRHFFSGNFGELRPVYLEDTVPGDTYKITPQVRIYFAPLAVPTLANIKCRIDYFFVPNRLAWDQFDDFITGGADNNLNPAYPNIKNVYAAQTTYANTVEDWTTSAAANNNSIICDLGHPTIMPGGSRDFVTKDPMDMIPLYDYLLIYDEYYRDEEKENYWFTQVAGIKADVYNCWASTAFAQTQYDNGGSPLRIAWAKDYFTSASLYQQRGVDIPLLNPINAVLASTGNPPGVGKSPLYIAGPNNSDGAAPGNIYYGSGYALASSLTINGLYRLKALQVWCNRNVVGGTRYIEQMRYHHGVISSDARLQRPEMIGSCEFPVSIVPVTQTSATDDTGEVVYPLADRAGQAQIVGSSKTLTFSCEEYGYIIGILHVAPKPAYFQGLRRNLQRTNRFDFFWHEFEDLPQQPIYKNEIWVNAQVEDTLADTTPWAYQSMFSEYKLHNDEIHGDFRDSLLYWTMARKFTSMPSPNSAQFLKVDSDPQGNNRIFAVPGDTDDPHLFGVVNNIVIAKRPIKNYEPVNF